MRLSRAFNKLSEKQLSGFFIRMRSFFPRKWLMLLFFSCSILAGATAMATGSVSGCNDKTVMPGFPSSTVEQCCSGEATESEDSEYGAVSESSLNVSCRKGYEAACLPWNNVSQLLVRSFSKNNNSGRISARHFHLISFWVSTRATVSNQSYASGLSILPQSFSFQVSLQKVKPVRAGPLF